MKVINAKKGVLLFPLGNEQMIQVAPGKLSENFIADANVIRSLIIGNRPEEVGFILSSSYELDIARNVTGCIPYIYNTDEEAIEKLIKGRDFTPTPNNPAKALDGLKLEIARRDDTISNLNKEIEEKDAQLAELLKSQKPNIEKIDSLSKEKVNLEANVKNLEKVTADLKTELESANTKSKSQDSEIKSLKSTIATKDSMIQQLQSEKQQLIDEGNKTLKSVEDLKSVFKQVLDKFDIQYNPETKEYFIPEKSDDKSE